jgi:glycosyltransferase involved in cell wall biosynthesis
MNYMKTVGGQTSTQTIKNIMLLTNKIDKQPAGGRELLCKLNHDILKNIYGDEFTLIELDRYPIRGIKSVLGAFKGYVDGLSSATIALVLQELQRKEIGQVFVDGSNLGEVVREIKKSFPKVQVCTFFHNVESRFFLGALKQTKTPQALAVFVVNYLAERKAVRFSDKIICLSKRDSQLLNQVYGREATHFSPMALQDKLPRDFSSCVSKPSKRFALFVGGLFYANQAGITWFVENVVPRIQIKICIVGRGFEQFREELNINGKVEVIGEVASLTEWYRDAHFVIAPIFDGSGMKTKVAEALMYGKRVIGTPEAFTGYEHVAEQAGHICCSADEFIAAIDSEVETGSGGFNSALRDIYRENFSYNSARNRLENILTNSIVDK